MYAFNAKTGKNAWSFKTGAPLGTTPAVDGGKVFVSGSNDPNLYAIDARTGELVWSKRIEKFIRSPAVANGRVVVGAGDNVYAYDADDGKQLWTQMPLKPTGCSIANDVTYCGNSIGLLNAYDLKTGAELAEIDFPTFFEPILPTPVVVDGSLYVSGGFRVFALKLP